ncbi:hypothetical protein EH31_13290 [Erythrobacter longus]|uniref:Uncharacterized protein n=1 Tax=Erythrobacter longus TaxID=1044 RepID=A0A074M8C5_ERYLO|nr:hypothetical protein [Erythrobacter longus]KEO89015.1 hypothetical protein EH31_13290 [Erythrobacter longus]
MDPIMIPILGIVFGCTIPVVAIWAKHQQKLAKIQGETTAHATAEKAAQYAAQVAKLEDRVQVLERIVTDRGYDIATQIEALRDTREVESDGAITSDLGVPLNIGNKEKA